MPDSRGAAFAARLESAADTLLAEVSALSAALISWKPAPDVWSVMEILCHVAEFVPYWTVQTTQVASRPDEEWGRTHTDAARLAAVARADSRTLEDVTNEIHAAVRNSADTLRAMTDTSFETPAMSRNPRWGLKPAAFIVEHLLVEHVDKHIGQVRRNVSQFGERFPTA